jgi:geranylgeranyl reductase family protein
VYGACVHFGDAYIEVRKAYRIAVTVSRTDFDHFLLWKAKEVGVKTVEGRRASGLQQGKDYIEVIADKDKYVGRMVIGADGFNSMVARYIRPKHSKEEYGICVESKIAADDRMIDQYIHNAVDIHFNIAHGGYGWVFPHRGYFSVGVGGLASRFSHPKAVMRHFLETIGFPSEVRMKGCPIPVGGIHRNIVADRLLLAGDAAGFVDTFYGEGLAFAIRSGQLAADVAATALRAGNCSAQGLMPYDLRCKQEFEKDLRYSLYFSRLMHWFPKVFLRLMATETKVLDKYLEVPARRRSYRRYLGWLLPRVPFLLGKQFIHLNANRS